MRTYYFMLSFKLRLMNVKVRKFNGKTLCPNKYDTLYEIVKQKNLLDDTAV